LQTEKYAEDKRELLQDSPLVEVSYLIYLATMEPNTQDLKSVTELEITVSYMYVVCQ